MSTRRMSDPEYAQFLNDHPDIESRVQAHESLYLLEDHPRTWDQIAIAAAGDKDPSSGLAVPIPPRGIALFDPGYGNVIIYPDASGYLYFLITDNDSLAHEIQQPVFTSDPGYLDNYKDLLSRLAAALREAVPVFGAGFGLALAIGLVGAFLIYGPKFKH